LLLLAVSLCCGCGSKFADVTGKVTMAGLPVDMGTIQFVPADGQGPTGAEKIKEGQYAIRLRPGQYKVEIHGYRKTGERHHVNADPKSPIKDSVEEIVPERYNGATTLTREIKPGTQQEDFPLN